MSSFKDSAGRSWEVSVNVAAVKRVRRLTNCDLLDLDVLSRLHLDLVLLGDVLYALCQPECDARGVSDEEFGRALAGDALAGALTALAESWADFFADPAMRRNLRKVLDRYREISAVANQQVAQRLENLTVDELLPPQSAGNSSIAPPASAE